jgi:hypothetical protein
MATGRLAILSIFAEKRMFNGLQNWLVDTIEKLTDEEVKTVMEVAERMYPETKDINHSYNLKAIEKSMDALTAHNDLFIIYVMAILEYRKMANAFCAWCRDNN